jgi:hypothetical protein
MRLLELFSIWGALTAVFSLRYGGAVWHVGVFWIVLLYEWWCATVEVDAQPSVRGLYPANSRLARQAGSIATLAFLGAGVFLAIDAWKNDILYPYSRAYETAKFINEYQNRNNPATILTTSVAFASSLLPYLSKTDHLEALEYGKYSYVKWNKAFDSSLKVTQDPKLYLQKLTDTLKSRGEDRALLLYCFDGKNREMKALEMKALLDGSKYFKHIFGGIDGEVITDEVYVVYEWQP